MSEPTAKAVAFAAWMKHKRYFNVNEKMFDRLMLQFEKENPEYTGAVTLQHLQNQSLPSVITSHEGGPKMIGEIDREVVNCDDSVIRLRLLNVGEVLKAKHGEEQFKNELGVKIKQDFAKLNMAPQGSHFFIADSAVTVAFRKDVDGITVEIRRPGQPYERGKLEQNKALKLLGVQTGED